MIKYVPFSLFRFCAMFAAYIINSLWCLNYCWESEGFWKICRLCYGYDACLTFPQTWSVVEGVNGAQAWMLALSFLIGNACAPHCWKLYLKNRKLPQHYLTSKKGPHQLIFCRGILKLGLMSHWRHWLISRVENIPWPNVWLLQLVLLNK